MAKSILALNLALLALLALSGPALAARVDARDPDGALHAPRHEITPAPRSPGYSRHDVLRPDKRQVGQIWQGFGDAVVDEDFALGIYYDDVGSETYGCVQSTVRTIGDVIGCGDDILTACVSGTVFGLTASGTCAIPGDRCVTHAVYREIGDSTSLGLINCDVGVFTFYQTPTELSAQPTRDSELDDDEDDDDGDEDNDSEDDDDDDEDAEDDDDDEDEDDGAGATASSMAVVFGVFAGVAAFLVAM